MDEIDGNPGLMSPASTFEGQEPSGREWCNQRRSAWQTVAWTSLRHSMQDVAMAAMSRLEPLRSIRFSLGPSAVPEAENPFGGRGSLATESCRDPVEEQIFRPPLHVGGNRRRIRVAANRVRVRTAHADPT